MKHKINLLQIIIFSVISLSLLYFATQVCLAFDVGLNYVEGTELGKTDIRITIARIIQSTFGLLGIIVVVLIIFGGILYLVSMGEAERAEKAKKVLKSTLIGLIIILLVYAITSLILSTLQKSIGPGAEPKQGSNQNEKKPPENESSPSTDLGNYIPGDVDGDGYVQSNDLSLLDRVINGMAAICFNRDHQEIDCKVALDLNHDGQVDNNDKQIMNELITGPPEELPIINYIPGDGNGDGYLGNADLNLMQAVIAGNNAYCIDNTGSEIDCHIVMDMNGNGQVDDQDMQILVDRINNPENN
jgi:hypothetical protein